MDLNKLRISCLVGKARCQKKVTVNCYLSLEEWTGNISLSCNLQDHFGFITQTEWESHAGSWLPRNLWLVVRVGSTCWGTDLNRLTEKNWPKEVKPQGRKPLKNFKWFVS